MTIDLTQFHDAFFEESFEALDSMEAALLRRLYSKSYTPEWPLAIGRCWSDSSMTSRRRGEF